MFLINEKTGIFLKIVKIKTIKCFNMLYIKNM